jgi:hypothetical protein
MHLEQALVGPETRVAVRRIGEAVITQAADVHNPATAMGHLTATQTAAPDWFGTGYRLRLCACCRRGNRDGTLEGLISFEVLGLQSVVKALHAEFEPISDTSTQVDSQFPLCYCPRRLAYKFSESMGCTSGSILLEGGGRRVEAWYQTASFQNVRWILP